MKSVSRLQYLDWVRGLAAIVMLQGHVFDSFCNARQSGAFLFSQFLGGMPPAIFLFLTGVTFAFLMDSKERNAVEPARRVLASMKRAGYLFIVAFLFRIQLWAFARFFAGSASPWTDIFRVDILNCMGFAMLVMSSMALFRTAERVRLCAVLGTAIAAASPFLSQVDWSGVPVSITRYLLPDHLFFGFFPWAAFLAFGMSAGSLLRTLREDQIAPAMQWMGVAGLVLAFGGYTISNMSYSPYGSTDFWLNSPCLVFIKLGVICMVIPFAYIWTPQPAGEPAGATAWSWVRQFGVTSLLVYWVHIELVYGSWFGYFKEALTVPQTVLATIVVIGLMLLLSVIRTNYRNWRTALAWFGQDSSAPRRVPGD